MVFHAVMYNATLYHPSDDIFPSDTVKHFLPTEDSHDLKGFETQFPQDLHLLVAKLNF